MVIHLLAYGALENSPPAFENTDNSQVLLLFVEI